jgi:Ca-activated chloride channel homolog
MSIGSIALTVGTKSPRDCYNPILFLNLIYHSAIMKKLLLVLLFGGHLTFSQMTNVQQTALNGYVDYANQSAKEISIVVENLKSYYESTGDKKSWAPARFSCPVQPDVYYYENALKLGKPLNNAKLTSRFQDLKNIADSLDIQCKQLDTYYKLEDHKKDNHARGLEIMLTFPALLKHYRKSQEALQTELENIFHQLNKVQNAYSKADQLMRNNIAF